MAATTFDLLSPVASAIWRDDSRHCWFWFARRVSSSSVRSSASFSDAANVAMRCNASCKAFCSLHAGGLQVTMEGSPAFEIGLAARVDLGGFWTRGRLQIAPELRSGVLRRWRV